MAGASTWSIVPLSRANLSQEDLVEYPIPLDNLRVHDAFQTLLPGTPLADDLGLDTRTYGTNTPVVKTEDLKSAGATTNYARFRYVVPPEYVAGQSITLRLNAGMVTTVADTTAFVDAEAYREAAPAVDVCATAQQSINSLVAADKDFVITPTDVVVGDVLDIRVATIVTDGGGGAAVIAQINSIKMLLDIKG